MIKIITSKNILDNLNTKDYFGFTANSIIKSNKALVMGAGAAKDFKNRFKNLDCALGAIIDNKFGSLPQSEKGPWGYIKFGFVQIPYFEGYKLFAFQTKYSYADKSDLQLIEASTARLSNFMKTHEGEFHMNYPGIGLGGLKESEVQPILERYIPEDKVLYLYKKD